MSRRAGPVRTTDYAEVHSFDEAVVFLNGKQRRQISVSTRQGYEIYVIVTGRDEDGAVWEAGIEAAGAIILRYRADGSYKASMRNKDKRRFATAYTRDRLNQFAPHGVRYHLLRNGTLLHTLIGSGSCEDCEDKWYNLLGYQEDAMPRSNRPVNGVPIVQPVPDALRHAEAHAAAPASVPDYEHRYSNGVVVVKLHGCAVTVSGVLPDHGVSVTREVGR